MGEPNLFKIKHRDAIHDIIRKIILENIPGGKLVANIKKLISAENDESSKLKYKTISAEELSAFANVTRFS